MKFYGALRNVKRTGNLFVGKPPHQQLKYLPLSSGERMARQKLGVQQRFRLLNERQQNFRGYPKLSCQGRLHRQRQFRLPSLVELHEAIDAPIKEPRLLLMTSIFRRQQSHKFTAGRGGTAPIRQPTEIASQGTAIEEEESWGIASSDGFGFVQGRRQRFKAEIPDASKDFLHRAREKRVRAHNLDRNRHLHYALPSALYWLAGRS